MPEEFLDETDVDSCIYHNIFYISQSQYRIVRVSKGSNKKLFGFKLFQFSNLETERRCILQEDVSISERELPSLVDSLRGFVKTFDHASECIQILLPQPKVYIGSTKSKDKLFTQYYKDVFEDFARQIRLLLRFGHNKSCVFSVKILN